MGTYTSDYAQALEPNWYKLRPIVLKVHTEFLAPARPAFSKRKRQRFFKNAIWLWTKAISKIPCIKRLYVYWDDNPNEFNDTGHNTHFKHKVSPQALDQHYPAVFTKGKC